MGTGALITIHTEFEGFVVLPWCPEVLVFFYGCVEGWIVGAGAPERVNCFGEDASSDKAAGFFIVGDL